MVYWKEISERIYELESFLRLIQSRRGLKIWGGGEENLRWNFQFMFFQVFKGESKWRIERVLFVCFKGFENVNWS